uniref:hypothetical protein n=1 Tax=Aurantimonas coralicida TaxID=182270 RepID=UPI000B304871|nr:hypothetical protein [Aurantimonas coralicida]
MPEQVADWLKNGAEPKLRVLATETIYAFVYRASQKAQSSGAISCAGAGRAAR